MSTSARFGEYLQVTIHDNDFITSLEMVGKLLQNIFQFEETFPNEEDLPRLRGYIQNLWYNTQDIMWLMRDSERIGDLDYFKPTLRFVPFEEIPDWDNYESIFIPMFDGEILTR